jgi:diacylglycerol kinase family enzyme
MIKINEEHYCIHLSDLGLNAMLVKHFEHSKRRGMWEYAKAFLRVLLEKQVMRVAIKADEVSVVHKAFMVALANARKYGTGANINPEGNVADGKFEVVVVRRLNVFEILKAIFTNKSFDPQNIEVFSTMNLDLQTRHKAHFQVDGEYLGKITTVKARILPQILNVMVGTEEKRGEDLA